MKKFYILISLMLMSAISYSQANDLINKTNHSSKVVKGLSCDISFANCNYALANFWYSSDTIWADAMYYWDLGDGVHSTSNSCMHTYHIPGSYTVTLIVISNGDTVVYTKPNLIVIRNPPIVNFQYTSSDTLLYAPTILSFTNQTVKGDGDSLFYSWSFYYDSIYSTDTNISYNFVYPGTYGVSLKVTDNYGCQVGNTKEVIIKDTAQMGEISYITSDCDNNTVSPCGNSINYILENDTVKVYGFIIKNCCTIKTVTIRSTPDTIHIRQFDVGPLCTCNCGFCFAINVPDITQDSIYVTFNGQTVLVTKTLQGIKETNTTNNFTFYPIPTKDNLTIETNSNTEQKLEILNLIGQTVYTNSINKKAIVNTSAFANGVYILKLYSDKETIVRKFIKE